MLNVASVCTPYCMLFACCWELVTMRWGSRPQLFILLRILESCLRISFKWTLAFHCANYRSVILIFLLFLQKPDGEREDLGEFLYQYLNRRFGVENMIIEWGYNLYDACGRYTHDPRVGLFYGILQKEVLNNDDFSLRTYFPWYNHSL